MSNMLDLDYIRKWVDISDEELMNRLVKDAIGLQKEAAVNEQLEKTKKRLEDPKYPEMVERFLDTFQYLNQYFSKGEIVEASAHFIDISDITQETWIRGNVSHIEKPYMDFIRTGSHAFKEYQGSWGREVVDTASLFLMRNQYQSYRTSEITKYLLLETRPWLKDYKMNIYDVSNHNDWIYIIINDKSLYCPFSAIMNHDAQAIYDCHFNYWKLYNGTDTSEYLNSLEVKEFFGKISKN